MVCLVLTSFSLAELLEQPQGLREALLPKALLRLGQRPFAGGGMSPGRVARHHGGGCRLTREARHPRGRAFDRQRPRVVLLESDPVTVHRPLLFGGLAPVVEGLVRLLQVKPVLRATKGLGGAEK